MHRLNVQVEGILGAELSLETWKAYFQLGRGKTAREMFDSRLSWGPERGSCTYWPANTPPLTLGDGKSPREKCVSQDKSTLAAWQRLLCPSVAWEQQNHCKSLMHNMRNTEPGKSSWKEARVTQGRLSLIDDPDLGGAKNTVRFLWSGDGQSKRGSPQSSDSVREGGRKRKEDP